MYQISNIFYVGLLICRFGFKKQLIVSVGFYRQLILSKLLCNFNLKNCYHPQKVLAEHLMVFHFYLCLTVKLFRTKTLLLINSNLVKQNNKIISIFQMVIWLNLKYGLVSKFPKKKKCLYDLRNGQSIKSLYKHDQKIV